MCFTMLSILLQSTSYLVSSCLWDHILSPSEMGVRCVSVLGAGGLGKGLTPFKQELDIK